jgi:hypothetical protein
MSIQITIPVDLSDITIGQWQAVTKLEKAKIEGNDMHHIVEVIKLFTDEADRNRVVFVETGTLLRIFSRIVEAFGRRPNTEQVFKFIEMGGEDYGVNPNLSATTAIEYAEAVEVAKQGDEQLHNLMQIFVRKVTKMNGKGEYWVEPYAYSEERAKLIQDNMPMDFALNVQAFFLTILTNYTSETKRCLDQFPERKYTMN